MKVIRFNDARRYEPQEQWVRASLCDQKDISIEHFVKPAGHVSPRHSHSNSQVLALLSGKVIVHSDNYDDQEIKQGDVIYIPGDEPHWVANPLDEPAAGLDIFVPGRSFEYWTKQLTRSSRTAPAKTS
ncbi:MAG: cupin domain-containing protein [Woeseia sp.]